MDDGRQSSFSEYLGVLRRNAWIVIVVTVIAAAAAYFISSQQHKVYAATSQALIPSQSISLGSLVPGNVGGSSLDQARNAATDAQIAMTPPVAAMAVKNGHVHMTAATLDSKASVSADPSTNVLTFTVQSNDPATAVAGANALALAYTQYRNAKDQAVIAGTIKQLMNTQRVLEAQATASGKSSTNASQLAKLTSKIATARTTQQAMLQSGATVVKKATSASQVKPDPKKDAVLGAAIGLVLGVGLAILRNLLDTKVRTADDVGHLIGLPLLARLSTPPRSLRSKHGIAIFSQEGGLAEEYRKLRLAIDFANLNARAKTMVVTSSLPGEGKSTTVANLGSAFALAGRRVIVVDLDLRRPQLNLFFDVANRPGVTDVARGLANVDDALAPIDLGSGAVVGQNNQLGSLHIMQAGPLPPNPAEFFEAAALSDLLEQLRDRADLVLIDSAPLLPVSDTVGLSQRVDAMVVLARAEIVTRPALKETRRVLGHCAAAKLGFLFTGAETESGYGYSQYYGAYGSVPIEQPSTNGARGARPEHEKPPTSVGR